MSTNRNRAKLNKAQSNKEYKAILYDIEYPLYWDECIRYYGKIIPYQVRMYKTWKYNRRTQWKQ
jgi:hypothetical protein